ncbi:EFR1 family ferrodoxin [Anaerosporobacter sp.]|uniref:EFR1 family ferrodoxin n=1 Tax=Anaerosporobacter sp. TaxID=1872529 RepID=UPI00286EC7F0|nr:EFR1 family ferrodoxin [Anaerosporobacter sp.]
MIIFYFTSTGNSLAVAKRIGGEMISIPQVIDSTKKVYKDDVIGVVFPIYSLAAPKIVCQFLSKVKFEADYTFAIGTYGNMPGAAMHYVQKLAEKQGYRFDYVNHLFMLDNFLPVFEIGAEIEKLPKKKVEEMTAKIVTDINGRKHLKAPVTLGAKALTSIIDPLTSNTAKSAQKYIVNDQCTKCGVCVKVCPTKNISVTSKVQFSDRCTGCEACLHHCPQNAIHLKNEKSNKRWRNPDVSLNEIITANNRN